MKEDLKIMDAKILDLIEKLLTALGYVLHFDVEFTGHVTQIWKDDEPGKNTGNRVPNTDDDRIPVTSSMKSN